MIVWRYSCGFGSGSGDGKGVPSESGEIADGVGG
jgi:hypothetical protein